MTTLRALTLGAIALSAIACGDKEPIDTQPCDVGIEATFPADGATNAYYRGAFEVHFTDPQSDEATIAIDGVTGTTTWNDDGDIGYFTPDEPLSPNTQYTANIDYCFGEAPVSFTTSGLGTAISDPSSLTDNVYSLNLQDGRVVIPEGVGSVLEQYLEVSILIEVANADGSNLSMFGALASDGDAEVQDYCNQTLDFPDASFAEAPFFSIGPADTTISVAGYSVTIDQLEISGTFASDGSYWGGGVLAGSVDTRALKNLVGDDAEDNAVCDLVAGFGVSCVACGDGSGDYCLEIKAVDLGGDLLANSDIEVIETEDCHASCGDTCADTDGDGTYDAFTNGDCALVFEEVCAQ